MFPLNNLACKGLTQWGLLMPLWLWTLINIGSGNGWVPAQYQAIPSTNVDFLLMGTLRNIFE